MNLLGYCEEDEPFTRMVVFEYASNGTLFEHLHSEFLTLSSNLHHFSVYKFFILVLLFNPFFDIPDFVPELYLMH